MLLFIFSINRFMSPLWRSLFCPVKPPPGHHLLQWSADMSWSPGTPPSPSSARVILQPRRWCRRRVTVWLRRTQWLHCARLAALFSPELGGNKEALIRTALLSGAVLPSSRAEITKKGPFFFKPHRGAFYRPVVAPGGRVQWWWKWSGSASRTPGDPCSRPVEQSTR